NADEWEYVDENGNPVEADDADEWEYVDENITTPSTTTLPSNSAQSVTDDNDDFIAAFSQTDIPSSNKNKDNK
ncbi:MAG: hypothetical protein IJ099_04415, partial [Alphaproteobacteria bacterium]|nr:hypothetical protein [Alphaproteobacteria bacterium]